MFKMAEILIYPNYNKLVKDWKARFSPLEGIVCAQCPSKVKTNSEHIFWLNIIPFGFQYMGKNILTFNRPEISHQDMQNGAILKTRLACKIIMGGTVFNRPGVAGAVL